MNINEISGIIWICVGAAMSMWLMSKLMYAAKIEQVFLAKEVTWLMAFNSLAWGMLLFGAMLFSQ